MEKFFTNKSIWKKIVVAILIVMAFQVFVSVPKVRAVESDAAQDGDNLLFKGILMRPVLSLLVSIGDGVVNLLHNAVMGQEMSLITVEEGDWWEKAGAVLLGLLALIGAVVLIVYIGWAVIIPTIEAFCSAAAVASAGAVAGASSLLVKAAVAGGLIIGVVVGYNAMPGTFKLPVYSYSAEEIFKGNILLFNVNFFNNDNSVMVNYSVAKETNVQYTEVPDGKGGTQQVKTDSDVEWEPQDTGVTVETYENTMQDGNYKVNYYYFVPDGKEDVEENRVKTSPQNSARELHSIISRWYVTIRNICIVIMLSVLIYIGIRMMLTTIASDKAKYKEMLKDWVVGICLLFVMHYIMAFSVTLVEKITTVVDTSIEKKGIMVHLPDKYDGNLKKAAEELGMDVQTYVDEENNAINYPTNLMGKMRILMQLNDESETGVYIGYVICFLILVLFTVWFTFTYIKRLLYMAFLTIISPLVAMTYCIDKINDGQAQGFNMWLKEYIFNLLIQPMHLLLYFILVSSAFELSSTNIIYSLVALGFMIPAEKLLRSMFGFEKAKTPPLLGGPIGTSLMMQGINGLSRMARGGRGNKEIKARGENGEDTADSSNILNHVSTMDTFANNTEKDGIGAQKLSSGNTATDESEDLGSRWATPELGETMAALDEEEQNLREMAYSDVRDSESLEAYQNLKDELDEKRKDALLEDYKIRMANEQALNVANEETDDENDSDTTVLNPTEGVQQTEKRAQPRESTIGAIGRGIRRTRREFGGQLRRTASATKAGAKVALRNAPRKIGKTTFKLAKGLAGGVVAGTAIGTIGAAAAIASGDEKNIITAAGATIGTGYAAGRRAANSSISRTISSHISPETRAAFDEVYHGEEYKKLDVEKASREARQDPVNQLKAERGIEDKSMAKQLEEAERRGDSEEKIEELKREKQKADKRAAKRFMDDDGNYDKMIKAGVTDIDRAIVLQKGIDEGVYKDVDDAVAHSQLYDQFGQKDPGKMGAKDQTNFNKTIHNGLTKRGINNQVAESRTQEISDGLSFLHKGLNS